MTVVNKRISNKALPMVLLGLMLVASLAGMNIAAKENIKNTFDGGIPEVIDDDGALGGLTMTNITLPKDAHVINANMTMTPLPGQASRYWNLTTGADFASPYASRNMSVVGDKLMLNTTTVQWTTDTQDQWNEGFLANVKTDGGTATMAGTPGMYGDVPLSSSGSNNIEPWAFLATDGKMHAVWADDRTDANGDIYYGVSTDNGITYGSEHLVAGGAGGQRKPHIEVFGSKLYVIYQNPGPDATCSWTTYFTSSTDGGTSWSVPVNLSCSAHKEAAIGGVGDLAVDHAGNPHVVSMNENTLGRWIYYVKSSNGGTTWDTPKLVYQPVISVITDIEVDSQNKPWIFFKMEKSLVLKSTTDGGVSWSKHFSLTDKDPMTFLGEAAMHMDSHDVVHAVWRDRRLGNEDIYYTQFNITTENITPNIPVIDDPAKKDQNNAFVNVNSKGEIYVSMIDLRNDTTGDPYFTYSKDGGKTWSGEYRIDTAPDAASMSYLHVFFDSLDRPHFMWSDGRTAGVSKAFQAMGPTNGTIYFSKVLDLGKKPYAITKVDVVKSEPGGTNVSVFVRCSPDGIIWSRWFETFGDNLTLLQWDQFLQWKAEFHNAGAVSPTVDKVVVESVVVADNGYYILPVQNVPDIAQLRVNWDIAAFEGTLGIYLSHNLSNWELLGKGGWRNFAPADGNVYLNISMGTVGRSPLLSSLTVEYMINVYPTAPALRFGDSSSTPVWTKTGELRAREDVNLTTAINDHISDWNAANPNAEVISLAIPLNLSFSGPGRIKMEGLNISYNRVPTAPLLKNPVDGAMLANQMAKFELVSSDGDSDMLDYEIQLSSSKDFTTIARTFGSTHPGWDKTSYFSGVTAELTPGVSEALLPGTYYWRGRANDGTMWSPYAQPAKFIIDATAPNGTIGDAGATAISVDTLIITLNINDPETGVTQMVYGVGTTIEGKELRDSTQFSANASFQITDLVMVAGPTYYVWVMAMNGAGMWSSKISTDGITLAVPDVTLDYPEGVQKELTITVTTSASDPGGAEIVDGDLEFRSATVDKGVPGGWSNWREVGAGDGGDLEVTEFTGTEGIAYQFRFRAKNEYGFWGPYAEGTKVVRINALPQARIVGPSSLTAGKSGLFDGTTSFDADGDTVTYEWTFDGGSKATTPTVEKSFSGAGTKTVSLKVCDSFGCNETTLAVSVKAAETLSTGMMAGIGAGMAIVIVVIALAAIMMMRKKKAKAQEAKVQAAAAAAPPVSPYQNYPPLPPQGGMPLGAIMTDVPQYPPPQQPQPAYDQQQQWQEQQPQAQQSDIPMATATATEASAPEEPKPEGRRPSFEPPPQ